VFDDSEKHEVYDYRSAVYIVIILLIKRI